MEEKQSESSKRNLWKSEGKSRKRVVRQRRIHRNYGKMF